MAHSPLEKAGVRLGRRLGWPGRWPHRALRRPCCAASHHNASQRALAHWRRQTVRHNTLAHNQRAQQMALTLEWWRWAAIPESEYQLVNLPAYTLEMVRGGQMRLSQRIITERPDRATPTLNSRVTSFTIAPE